MSAGCIPIVPDVGGLKEIVPRHLRYKSVKEAAVLTEETLNTWSPLRACDMVEASNKFSQKNFFQNFLGIIKL
jgi:glycogen synthase